MCLTTSFSSEDGWRGACASRRRDRRLRLLQALVRFAALAWTRCLSTFLQDIQPRHRARPEPQPTRLVLQTLPNPRMILRPRPGAKPANSVLAPLAAKARPARAPQSNVNQGLGSCRDCVREPIPGLERRPRAGRDCARIIQDGRRLLSPRPATWRSRPEAGPAANRARPAPQPRQRKPRPRPSA